MSANVESLFYVRETPWHGLGTRVMEAPSSKDALILAGLDWRVVQKPIYTKDGYLIDGYKANVRDMDDAELLCKTANYKENLFARTMEGNVMIDRAYQILKSA